MVRVGSVLIIKKTDAMGDSVVLVRELIGTEIRALELNAGIQKDPQSALHLLALAVAELDEAE